MKPRFMERSFRFLVAFLSAGTFCFIMLSCSNETNSETQGSSSPSVGQEHPDGSRTEPSSQQPKDSVDKMAQQIERGGASVPGLAPTETDPDTVYFSQSTSYGKKTVVSQPFSVGQNWRIHYQAGPVNPATVWHPGDPVKGNKEVSYFEVELFNSSQSRTERGALIIDKQFSTLPMFAEETDSDSAIFPKGGRFFLKITSNVPYALDVRK